jgi:hypothetical protein
MSYVVKKRFFYSLNGRDRLEALPGPCPKLPEYLIPGLLAEEFIGEPEAEQNKMLNPVENTQASNPVEQVKVEIPEDWASFNADQMKGLATSITGETYGTKADAEMAINKEIMARATVE